jgi:chromosome segregation ATPase
MTERIQLTIDEIRLKYKALHSQLMEQRQIIDALETDLQFWKSEQLRCMQEQEECKLEISDLKNALDVANSQVVEGFNSSTVQLKEAEIDELVKEIEYCIAQLKK